MLADGVCTPLQYKPVPDNLQRSPFRRVAAELADVDGCAVHMGAMSPTSRHWAQSLGVLLVPLTDDLTRLRGFLRGPPDTPFTGATFAVDITVGKGYPFEPPTVKFCTGNTPTSVFSPRMVSVPWHPNVSSQTGYICCTILKEGGWGPAHTLKLLLQGLQTLLQCPEWDDPVNDEVRCMWQHSPSEYETRARKWSKERALDASLFDRMLASVPNTALLSSSPSEDVVEDDYSLPKPNGGEGGLSSSPLFNDGVMNNMNKDEDYSGTLVSFKMSTKKRKKSPGNRDWCGAVGDSEGSCSIC